MEGERGEKGRGEEQESTKKMECKEIIRDGIYIRPHAVGIDINGAE